MKTDFIALKKHRDRKTGKVTILSEKINVKNRDLIIVDDMISTGGSIVKGNSIFKETQMQTSFCCMYSRITSK